MTVVQNGAVLAPGNYTVAPVNNNYDNGGSVTLNTACPTGQTLFLQRVTPITQLTQFTPYMPALYANIEDGLDQLTEIAQDKWEETLALSPITPGGIDGYVWTSNGPSTSPSWEQIPYPYTGHYIDPTITDTQTMAGPLNVSKINNVIRLSSTTSGDIGTAINAANASICSGLVSGEIDMTGYVGDIVMNTPVILGCTGVTNDMINVTLKQDKTANIVPGYASMNMFTVLDGATIDGLSVDTSSVTAYSGAVITINSNTGYYNTITLKNLRLFNYIPYGGFTSYPNLHGSVGISLVPPSSAGIQSTHIESSQIIGYGSAISMNVLPGVTNTWIGGLVISGVDMIANQTCLYINGGTTVQTDASITGSRIEHSTCEAYANGLNTIVIDGRPNSVGDNMFIDFLFSDYQSESSPSVSVSVSSGVGTVTLPYNLASVLSIGSPFALQSAGVYTGIYKITGVNTTTNTVTFSTSAVNGSSSAIWSGSVITSAAFDNLFSGLGVHGLVPAVGNFTNTFYDTAFGFSTSSQRSPSGDLLWYPSSASVVQLGTVSNLVPDSDFKFGSSSWGISNLTIGTPSGQNLNDTLGQNSLIATTSTALATSSTFSVIAGQTYQLSGFIGASNVTGGLVYWQVYVPGLSWYSSAAFGVNGADARISASITIPTNSTYPVGTPVSAILLFEVSGVSYGSTSLTFGNTPMLQQGNVETAYLSNIYLSSIPPSSIGPGSLAITQLGVTGVSTLSGGVANSNGTLLPSTATSYKGNSVGGPVLAISGTTGSIGGSALTAGNCASGTATITGGTAGHPAVASESDGTFIGGSYTVRAVTTSSTAVTVQVCAVIAGTPTAKTYNVLTF
jgi:hypothetical protein